MNLQHPGYLAFSVAFMAIGLCLPSTHARDAGAAHSQQCNAAASDPISYVAMPGHPFGTVLSKDGCWVFVSVGSSGPRSLNGVAMLSRAKGKLELTRVFPVEQGPSGMVITHDGKLLIVADDDYVVFLDVLRMTSGRGDPILGYLKDGDSPGSAYVNVTADDSVLLVSDEYASTVTVINLAKARAESFKETSIVGKIPMGNFPVALVLSADERWLYTTSLRAPESFAWPIVCTRESGDPADPKPQFSEGAVIVVDLERAKTDPSNSVVSRVPAGCSPARMAVSPGGERVFVTARHDNALLVFDTTLLRTDGQHSLVGKVSVGAAPVGVAVSGDGKFVLVGNSNSFADDQVNRRQTLTADLPGSIGGVTPHPSSDERRERERAISLHALRGRHLMRRRQARRPRRHVGGIWAQPGRRPPRTTGCPPARIVDRRREPIRQPAPRADRGLPMNRIPPAAEDRIALLERSLQRTQWAAAVAALVLLLLALVGTQLPRRPPSILDEVRTRRLVVVDDAGHMRVAISQDPKDSQRRSRSAGLTVFDSTGTERGGFSTLDDGGVTFGMDAPRGVGAPMGERLSLSVGADGSADVMLLDNLTRAVAKLRSDGDGRGGVQVFKWDMEGKKIDVRTVVYDGDRYETVPMN